MLKKCHENKSELLPCPLCGGEAADIDYGVRCRKCGLWLGVAGYREKWNTRALMPLPDELDPGVAQSGCVRNIIEK